MRQACMAGVLRHRALVDSPGRLLGQRRFSSKLNIGHRHILPTYPAMFILAGAAAIGSSRRGRLRWAMLGGRAGVRAWPGGRMFCHVPALLGLFQPIAGGPSNGYRHLVDSSLDWGQDLPGLKRWLTEHDLDGPDKTPVYLAYFGTASPAYYQISATELCGLRATLPSHLTGGVYCISATDLQRVYDGPQGNGVPNTRRLIRKYCWPLPFSGSPPTLGRTD